MDGRRTRPLKDAAPTDGRTIISHLGNGASMAAVHHGIGNDTTMGPTPTGRLVMSTRTGDLDQGVLPYLPESSGPEAAVLNHFVNKGSGLLGISGSGADMRDVLAREAMVERAAGVRARTAYHPDPSSPCKENRDGTAH